MRSYFLVGDCPDLKSGAEPDDPRFDHALFLLLSHHGQMENGMYREGAMFIIACPSSIAGKATRLSYCTDGAWTPPTDCTGSNIII